VAQWHSSAQPGATVSMRPAGAMPARPAGTAPSAAHRTGDGMRPTWRQGRGSASAAGAAVASQIPALAVDEVG
jgi:hypothetical protein